MTEKELRSSICAAATGWLGLHEKNFGHRVIVETYNAIRPLPAGYALKESDPWCAAFVSAAAAKAGLTGIVFPECSCPRMAALYKAAGRWEEVDFAVPRPGDVIFYDWDGDRVPDHVGLVTVFAGDRLTVAEGNKSDAVALRHISVDSPYIYGYGQPDYLSLADEAGDRGRQIAAPTPETSGQPVGADIIRPQTTDSALSLPVLSAGCAGETVRAAQLLLIGRGCRCGPCGADGEFGPGTLGGVLSFQRGHRLEADGVVGPATWRSLLGLGVSA